MKNDYKLRDNCGVIYAIHQGKLFEILVDKGDLKKLLAVDATWNLVKKGPGYHVRAEIKGRRHVLHRFLLNPPTAVLVDHINGNGLDNRRRNLRWVGYRGNAQNRKAAHSAGSSGHLNVHRYKDKWQVSVVLNGHRKHLGTYRDKAEAVAVAERARRDMLPHSFEALQAREEAYREAVSRTAGLSDQGG